MPDTDGTAFVLFVIGWVVSSALTGGVIALIAVRMHPAMSFGRLWRFYSVLMALTVLAVFAIVWL